MSDDEPVTNSNTNSFHDMNNFRLTEIELKLQELIHEKTKYNVEKLVCDIDFLQSEIDHLRHSTVDINKETFTQKHIKNTSNLQSSTRLQYTSLETALQEKERYKKELENSNPSDAYRELLEQQIESICEALPYLQQQEEYFVKFQQTENAEITTENNRKQLKEHLNTILHKLAELKELLNYNTTRLLELEIEIKNLLVERDLILTSIDGEKQRFHSSTTQRKPLDSPFQSFAQDSSNSSSVLKEQDFEAEEDYEAPTRSTEHVRLVQRHMPTRCITVEPGFSCCHELVGLRLECDDETFVNKENTSLKTMNFKRNINVYVGALDTKVPETNNLQIVSFKSSFACISKVLSIKDKLIYIIMSNALGKSVVPLIHKHRCVESIYILQKTDDQKQAEWMEGYSKIRSSESSIELLLKLIEEDINSFMQRPSHWSRSKTLLNELCLQTCQINLGTSMEISPKEDISKLRIITLFFGTHQLFTQSQSRIQIDELNSVDKCVQSIKDQLSTTVFLIVFTDRFDDIHSLLELDAIHAVYIVWNGHSNMQIETIMQHSKVSGVFGLDEDLLEQLISDICFYQYIRVHIPVINVVPIGSNIIDNPNKQQIDFLFFQLFSNIFPHIPAESILITNRLTSLLIDANITSNNLFNQFNSSMLHKSVPQLKTINQFLVTLSKPVDSSSITVYRAQLVSKKDLETIQNNTNMFLAIPAFFFASRSFRTVADICRRAIDSQLTVILLELTLCENMLIANLTSDIVVLSPDTVFRLVGIEYAVDGICYVQLESANDAMQSIKDQLQSKVGGRLTWLTFGNYLAHIKQFRAAKEYCHYLLGLLSSDHPSIASIYNNMGLICFAMDDHQEALIWFEKASSLNRQDSTPIVPDGKTSTTINVSHSEDSSTNQDAILSKMAEISCRLGDSMAALDFYQQAHEMTTDINLQKLFQEKILALSFVNKK